MYRTLAAVLITASVIGATETDQASPLSFTPYGLSQFRLRYDFNINNKNDTIAKSGNYSNRIAYKFGVNIKADDQTTFNFEIGNDWASTEEVTGDSGVYKQYKPYVHLAAVNWDPGYMHIRTGIIPVKGTALLDLIGRSIDKNKKNYGEAGHINWAITTDNSLIGLNTGVPILKDDFKLGIEFTTVVLESRKVAAVVDGFRRNASSVALFFNVPMSAGGLSLNPQLIITPSSNLSTDPDGKKHRDPEIGGGLDANYKINDAALITAGFGIAHISNENSRTGTTAEYDRTGINATVGTVIKLGPGKLNFDFNISFNDDSKKEDSLQMFPFIDLKYGWSINKYFSIMPRIRGFWYIYPDDRINTLLRPEIIFTGSF
jgi:hypothetical protein